MLKKEWRRKREREYPTILSKVIQKYTSILYADEVMSEILTSPIKCVPRRACTKGNLVSPSTIQLDDKSNRPWLSTAGYFRCGHTKCKACTHASVKKNLKSASILDSRPHIIQDYINCNTTFVVYMITCIDCNIQYIGCTSNALKITIRRHLSDISELQEAWISDKTYDYNFNKNIPNQIKQ